MKGQIKGKKSRAAYSQKNRSAGGLNLGRAIAPVLAYDFSHHKDHSVPCTHSLTKREVVAQDERGRDIVQVYATPCIVKRDLHEKRGGKIVHRNKKDEEWT